MTFITSSHCCSQVTTAHLTDNCTAYIFVPWHETESYCRESGHFTPGLWPETTWGTELHLEQGLYPSQQLTYSSWGETSCSSVFHLENSPEMIQPPRQIEEAAFGGEQLFLFALCGNLLFFSQNSSLSWVGEDRVATYSEIMSVMHYQLSRGLVCAWALHVSRNKKENKNLLNIFPTMRTLTYLLRVPCATKTRHFILLAVLVVKINVSNVHLSYF